ncbi:MAG: Holliday junction branch migration protein RuvA [bacterium]
MIGYLEGSVKIKDNKEIIVLTESGVGYSVSVTETCALSLENDSRCSFFIQTVVREDDISLYGFESAEEKELFNMFCRKVNKVGPRLALAILSAAPVYEVTSAISSSDTSFFRNISGIGKKTAEKIILELKDKVLPSSAPLGTDSSEMPVKKTSSLKDAEEALLSLGYNTHQIKRVCLKIKNPAEKSTEAIVREALRIITSGNI